MARIPGPESSLVIVFGATAATVRAAFPDALGVDDVDRSAPDAVPATDAHDRAFAHLAATVDLRLRAGQLAVVDGCPLGDDERRQLVYIARERYCLPVAIVVGGDEGDGDGAGSLDGSLRGRLERVGFRRILSFSAEEARAGIRLIAHRLRVDRRDEPGPFDIIGDIHGCYDELLALLDRLGYRVDVAKDGRVSVLPPASRKLVFLGDVVDRGPATPAVLRLVMSAVRARHALCVAGNHDAKLVRALRGARVKPGHGLEESVTQLAAESAEFREQAAAFLDKLPSHYVLDGGRLVVAHAGLREDMQGRNSGRVRQFALYGDTTGEIDGFGLPVRRDWAAGYRGAAAVVYGHTPVLDAQWVNNTLCIDTGCVFGNKLTALRYPEREIVSVPAERVHYEPTRPLEDRVATGDAGRE